MRKRTQAEEQQAQADQRAALEALQTQLAQAVEEIQTGDHWAAWLDFARGFHQYSFGNVMLIRAQRPGATTVASYRTWQGKGRQVRKGEKSLRVLAPVMRTIPLADPETGEPLVDEHGHPKTRRRPVAYKPVPVFDVSQTDGPPLPEPVRPELLEGQAPPGLWEALSDEVSARGYRLLHGDKKQLGGANGVTCYSSREIWVRHDVDEAQACKTLLHELGHVLLHDPDDGERVDCRGLLEVEAESVAYLVSATHGLDTGSYTFPYVASWAHGLAELQQVSMSDIVTRTGTRVMNASTALLASTMRNQADSDQHALADCVTLAVTRSDRVREDAESLQADHQTISVDDPDLLRAVLADSQRFFQASLGRSWVPAYLGRRGLYDAIGSHGLGCAPGGWTHLVDHLRGLGYNDTHIEAAGLASRTRTGKLIDRFRDRLTIPIHDHNDQLVAFAGRLNPETPIDRFNAKYVNSPNTGMFVKSEVLYGLGPHHAQIRGSLPVITEGPLDAIAIDLASRRTGQRMIGLAPGGTALTDQQVAHVRSAQHEHISPANTLCVAFDNDPAGRNAVANAWLKLVEGGIPYTLAAELPAGEDPASMLESGRVELLADAVHGTLLAETVADHRIGEAAELLRDNPARQLAAFRELVQDMWQRVPVEQLGTFIDHVAGRLNIERGILSREVSSYSQDDDLEAVVAHLYEVAGHLNKSSLGETDGPALIRQDCQAMTSGRRP